MGPSIGRALSEGFRAANRSWAGIGFFAGVLLLVTVISLITIASTRPPARQFPLEDKYLDVNALTPAPTAPPAAPPAAPAPEATPPSPSGDVNLFNQLETTQPPPASAAAETPSPVAQPTPLLPATDTAAERTDEQERADWLGRAWPVVAAVFLLMLVANVWLSGGQIAYLAARVSHQPAKLSVFWQEGTRVFGRLLGTWGLMMGAGAALLLVLALLGAALSPLPEGVRKVLGVLLVSALLAVGIWLVVRLSFWFIAVVVDRVGPVAGLKASLRATQGRWLKTAGLGLLVALISIGVSLAFGLVEGLGNLIGGGAAVVLGVAGNLAGLVASLYIGFAALAAFIQFYRDVKGQAASPS
jgi:hypothetical protein